MARRNSVFGLSPDTPQFVEVAIASIRPNPHQPRKNIDERTLAQLTHSIEQKGLRQPIVLVKTDEPDAYILGAGQRRLLAFQRLGRETIPAMITATGSPAEIALTENLQREDLNPIETADALAALMEEFGYTHEQLAEFLGEQRTTITELLSINKLPEEIRDECRALDNVTKTHLVALARLLDRPEEMQELWNEIRAGRRITTRELQRRQRGTSAPDLEAADVPRELKPVVRAMTVTSRLHDTLKKIKPASLAGHTEKLEELRGLHQQLGRLITRLTNESRKSPAVADDENGHEELAEKASPPASSQEAETA